MKNFEVGKIYQMFSIGDQNCTWTYIVKSRTAAMITLEDVSSGEVKRCRIIKKLSEYRKAESLYPLGNYSMCPVLSADKECVISIG